MEEQRNAYRIVLRKVLHSSCKGAVSSGLAHNSRLLPTIRPTSYCDRTRTQPNGAETLSTKTRPFSLFKPNYPMERDGSVNVALDYGSEGRGFDTRRSSRKNPTPCGSYAAQEGCRPYLTFSTGTRQLSIPARVSTHAARSRMSVIHSVSLMRRLLHRLVHQPGRNIGEHQGTPYERKRLR